MISYCIPVSKPKTAMILIQDLIEKTSVPYEILVWANTGDKAFLQFIDNTIRSGVPLRVVGKTPYSIGMVAFKILFQEAKFDMIAQVDEAVLLVSRKIAEKAASYFVRNPKIKQIVADVLQDTYTTGGRPPMKDYTALSPQDGLYEGPMDGWFAIYPRSVFDFLMEAPYERVFFLGSWLKGRIAAAGMKSVLCTKMRVWNTAGPAYSHYFGVASQDIQNLREAGKNNIAHEYACCQLSQKDRSFMENRHAVVRDELDLPESIP